MLESHEGVVAVLAVVVERMRNYFAWQARLQFINRCVARNEDTAEDARRRDFEQARTNGDAGKGGGDGADGGGGGDGVGGAERSEAEAWAEEAAVAQEAFDLD